VSYEAIADGELAAVVTFLEMTEPPAVEVPPSPLFLQRMDQPDLDFYRDLFRLVGSPWLWFSRLIIDDSKLTAILHDPGIELFEALDGNGRQVGMLELDFREVGACELAFVGLVPDLAGLGHGRWLLAEAVSRAWRDDVRRVHVHTCTLDHPAALAAYRRAGLVPFKRAIERFPDPRLSGILPLDSAPHVPLLGTLADPRPES
jgi:GNAT superfamily N-acetyltransferase